MGNPVKPMNRKNITIVQYFGDHKAAYELKKSHSGETYYGHSYVLDTLDEIQGAIGNVTHMCCSSPSPYDETLPSGVRIIGAGTAGYHYGPDRIGLIESTNPTEIIFLGPMTRFLRHFLKSDARIMSLLADSFELNYFRRIYRYGKLSSLLNNSKVEFIANHGYPSCRSLIRIGVNPNKILAWDWPYSRSPDQNSPKHLRRGNTFNIFFAGAINVRKGVGDIITSLPLAVSKGLDVRAAFAGDGEIEFFERMAEKHGVRERVTFLGRISNHEVFQRMRHADAVVVPSQHAYPEGFPLTIYESLCARTPIILSDHPMFVQQMAEGIDCLFYRSRKVGELADAITRIATDPVLYAGLSERSGAAWARLQIQLKWGDLIKHWISGKPDDIQWLSERSVSKTMPPR